MLFNKKMIRKYSGYFHDGKIRNIQTDRDRIHISMESAQLRPEWNEDEIPLSKRETLAGILHLSEIEKITRNKKKIKVFSIEESYHSGGIYDFDIEDNQAIFTIWWERAHPNFYQSGLLVYKITCEKVEWENIPTLFDTYWYKP